MKLDTYRNTRFVDGPREGYSPNLDAVLFWGMLDGNSRLRVRCLASRELVEDEFGVTLADYEPVPFQIKSRLWPRFQRLLSEGRVQVPDEAMASHLCDVVLS